MRNKLKTKSDFQNILGLHMRYYNILSIVGRFHTIVTMSVHFIIGSVTLRLLWKRLCSIYYINAYVNLECFENLI